MSNEGQGYRKKNPEMSLKGEGHIIFVTKYKRVMIRCNLYAC